MTETRQLPSTITIAAREWADSIPEHLLRGALAYQRACAVADARLVELLGAPKDIPENWTRVVHDDGRLEYTHAITLSVVTVYPDECIAVKGRGYGVTMERLEAIIDDASRHLGSVRVRR